MRVCPGFDAEEVSLAGVRGWTIVTSKASGFPAKFGIRALAGFESKTVLSEIEIKRSRGFLVTILNRVSKR